MCKCWAYVSAYVSCVLVENGLILLGQRARGHPSPPPASSHSMSGGKLTSVASRFCVSIHFGGLEEPYSSYLESRHDQPEAMFWSQPLQKIRRWTHGPSKSSHQSSIESIWEKAHWAGNNPVNRPGELPPVPCCSFQAEKEGNAKKSAFLVSDSGLKSRHIASSVEQGGYFL